MQNKRLTRGLAGLRLPRRLAVVSSDRQAVRTRLVPDISRYEGNRRDIVAKAPDQELANTIRRIALQDTELDGLVVDHGAAIVLAEVGGDSLFDVAVDDDADGVADGATRLLVLPIEAGGPLANTIAIGLPLWLDTVPGEEPATEMIGVGTGDVDGVDAITRIDEQANHVPRCECWSGRDVRVLAI